MNNNNQPSKLRRHVSLLVCPTFPRLPILTLHFSHTSLVSSVSFWISYEWICFRFCKVLDICENMLLVMQALYTAYLMSVPCFTFNTLIVLLNAQTFFSLKCWPLMPASRLVSSIHEPNKSHKDSCAKVSAVLLISAITQLLDHLSAVHFVVNGGWSVSHNVLNFAWVHVPVPSLPMRATQPQPPPPNPGLTPTPPQTQSLSKSISLTLPSLFFNAYLQSLFVNY